MGRGSYTITSIAGLEQAVDNLSAASEAGSPRMIGNLLSQ